MQKNTRVDFRGQETYLGLDLGWENQHPGFAPRIEHPRERRVRVPACLHCGQACPERSEGMAALPGTFSSY